MLKLSLRLAYGSWARKIFTNRARSARNFPSSCAVYPSPRIATSTLACGSPLLRGSTTVTPASSGLRMTVTAEGSISVVKTSFSEPSRPRASMAKRTFPFGQGISTDSWYVLRAPFSAAGVVRYSPK
jgi:hypothetical protein